MTFGLKNGGIKKFDASLVLLLASLNFFDTGLVLVLGSILILGWYMAGICLVYRLV